LVPADLTNQVRQVRGAPSCLGLFGCVSGSSLPGFNVCTHFAHASAPSVSLRSNPIETSRIPAHF